MLERLKRDRIFHPEDFQVLLYEPHIEIKPEFEIINALPRTLIEFGAEFEDDHGVSVLTDGKRVRGLGYQGEAELYRNDPAE